MEFYWIEDLMKKLDGYVVMILPAWLQLGLELRVFVFNSVSCLLHLSSLSPTHPDRSRYLLTP